MGNKWWMAAFRQRLVIPKRIDSIVAIKRNLYDNGPIKTFRYTELCKNWQQPWIFVKFVRQQFGFKRPFTSAKWKYFEIERKIMFGSSLERKEGNDSKRNELYSYMHIFET